MPIVVKTRTYDQDFYDALRAHPATMGGHGHRYGDGFER